MRNHKAFDIAAVAERFFSDAPYLIAIKFGRNLDSAGDFLVTIDYLRLLEMQNITVRTLFVPNRIFVSLNLISENLSSVSHSSLLPV